MMIKCFTIIFVLIAKSFGQIDEIPSSIYLSDQNAVSGQFSYHVFIKSYTDFNSSQICAGSLITPNHVLTASACTENSINFEMTFGTNDLHKFRFVVISTEVIDYNELALIKLSNPLTLSSSVGIVALPPADNELYENLPACVTGEYADGILKWELLRIMGNGECQEVMQNRDVIITDDQICGASFYGQTVNVCLDVVGSALVYSESKIGWTLIGVQTMNKCQLDEPARYIRVKPYLQWILNTIGE